MISYDPNKVPPLDAKAAAGAKEEGLIPVLVACFETWEEPNGVLFWLFVPAVPRIGEWIQLEGKKKQLCEVEQVLYPISSKPYGKAAIAHVCAKQLRFKKDGAKKK